jgi:hypothetical protein
VSTGLSRKPGTFGSHTEIPLTLGSDFLANIPTLTIIFLSIGAKASRAKFSPSLQPDSTP